MQVVLIYGHAASGKHTIGARLSRRLNLPLFHNHLTVDLAKTLFEFGTVGFNRLRATIWQAAFNEAASADRSFIFTFHPEATVDPQLIRDLVATVEASGGRVHFVELKCPTATVLTRISNESRARFGKLIDADLYVEIEKRGGFEFPHLPTALVTIDTSAVDVDAAVRQIEEALSRVA